MHITLRSALAAASALAAVACGGDEIALEEGQQPKAGFDDAAMQELLDSGIDKYLGRFEPSDSGTDGEVTSYYFEPDPDGPICLEGKPYRTGVRDKGSDKLLIYLQGGGACWTGLCSANESASAGVPPLAWTDGQEQNPLGDYNVVFAPYCDGSVFTGDNELQVGSGDNERTRYHHGLMNLSAVLDIARDHFPQPKQLVLAGSSAGGYGTIPALLLVRTAYPDVPVVVMDDAGPGVTNPEDPSLLEAMRKDWNFWQYIPESCPECESGQFTELVAWQLKHDPSLRVGLFSAYQDFVIGNFFLQMDSEKFQAHMVEQTGKIQEKYPDRYKRFFIDGSAHTVIFAGYYSAKIGDTVFSDWVDMGLRNDPEWPDLLQ